VAQPMAVETVRMPQNAANRTIDRPGRILARWGIRLPRNGSARIRSFGAAPHVHNQAVSGITFAPAAALT